MAVDRAHDDRPRPRVVLVAGASRGIGRAVAERCAARGDVVVAFSRSGVAAEMPGDVVTVDVDVRDRLAVADAVADAQRRVGDIDTAIQVVGITASDPIETMSADKIRDLFETNVVGPFNVVRAVLPTMRARGAGLVVNVSSQSAHLPSPYFAWYGASKAALEHLTVSLAHEVEQLGITVRLVVPGAVRTGILSSEDAPAPAGDVYAGPLDRQRRRARQAIDRGLPPESVAEVVTEVVDAVECPLRTPVGADARWAMRHGGLWPGAGPA